MFRKPRLSRATAREVVIRATSGTPGKSLPCLRRLDAISPLHVHVLIKRYFVNIVDGSRLMVPDSLLHDARTPLNFTVRGNGGQLVVGRLVAIDYLSPVGDTEADVRLVLVDPTTGGRLPGATKQLRRDWLPRGLTPLAQAAA